MCYCLLRLQVLLLVWDDKSNNSGLHPGLMATHDQETYEYFKDTGVVCLLCPREGGTEDTLLQVRRYIWCG
jgi:phospholipase D1/2